MSDQSSSDPQSWNLYVYAGNSPLKYTDPTGLWKQVECEGGATQCWEAEEGDTYESLADLLNLSPENLAAFFQNQEIVEGRVFDVSGYNDWMKEGDVNTQLKKMVNDTSWQMVNAEPPGAGGLKTVGKKSGLFGWIGKQLGKVGRWAGLIKPKKAPTVAQLAAKQLVCSSGKEMFRDAVNIVKAFRGTPQQKADLFEEFAKQIAQRTGGAWAAVRVTATDGAALFVGEAGEALIITQSGEIFKGAAAGGGWKVTTEGYVIIYEALKRLN